MQIVIELREEIVKSIKNTDKAIYPFAFDVANAIQNGTPLPKGHGRLIDADTVINTECGHSCSCYREQCGFDVSCKEVRIIENAPTIIEADMRGEKE